MEPPGARSFHSCLWKPIFCSPSHLPGLQQDAAALGWPLSGGGYLHNLLRRGLLRSSLLVSRRDKCEGHPHSTATRGVTERGFSATDSGSTFPLLNPASLAPSQVSIPRALPRQEPALRSPLTVCFPENPLSQPGTGGGLPRKAPGKETNLMHKLFMFEASKALIICQTCKLSPRALWKSWEVWRNLFGKLQHPEEFSERLPATCLSVCLPHYSQLCLPT